MQGIVGSFFRIGSETMPMATREQHRSRTKKTLLIAIVIVLVLLISGAAVAQHYWPLTESKVQSDLADDTSAKVRFGSFHETYFPLGCVAENVVFQRADSAPIITIRRLVIRAYLSGMLRNHVNVVRAEGMHILVSGSDLDRTRATGPHSIVDRLLADDAVFEIRRSDPQRNMRFVFHKFMMQNLGGLGPVSFSAILDNPMPAGRLTMSGRFGPWNSAHSENTAVSGKYWFENADMSVFGGIAGTLSSTGNFNGTFQQIDIEGATEIPELEITKTRHSLPLKTRFSASVDSRNGNIVFDQVKAKFGRNDILAQGSIGSGANGKRSANIDLRCARGRIEDVFYPFIHSPRSPLTGDVAFKMKVTIASGHEPFLETLDLSSDFQIHRARFTRAKTQDSLNKIAENPGQKTPNQTLSDFQGSVNLNAGVAHFSWLSVHDQGASAVFHGNYNLIDESVRMFGNLKTATSLTKSSSGGISAVFAKVLEPFFKKKPHVTVVPVKIGGTYTRPSFGLNM